MVSYDSKAPFPPIAALRPKPAVHDPPPDIQAPESAAPESKTRRKQAMHALQDLGEALVALDPRRLAALALPERFVDAIELARKTTRHEARRRQMQYIGRLMRELDPEPIRAALTAWAQGPERERAHFAALEQWRDRLLQETDAVEAFAAAFPQVDRISLASRVAAARARARYPRAPAQAARAFSRDPAGRRRCAQSPRSRQRSQRVRSHG